MKQPKNTRAEQARINGAKSRGPKTAEGHARAALGRNRTLLYGPNTNLLQIECHQAWDDTQQRYHYHFTPTSTIEHRVVNDLVAVEFELERVKAGMTRHLDLAVQSTPIEAIPDVLPHFAQTRLAVALKLVANSKTWSMLNQQARDLRRSRRDLIQTMALLKSSARPTIPEKSPVVCMGLPLNASSHDNPPQPGYNPPQPADNPPQPGQKQPPKAA